jgi:type IV pilus assembly protein PilC
MPAYRYRAVHASGRIAEGRLAAANEWELAQHLGDAGLELIEARAKSATATPRPRLRQRTTPRELAQFCVQMADLMQAGISFPDALQDIAATDEAGGLRDALLDCGRAIGHGSPIAAAFARHPRLFPDAFRAILGAGEKSGDLAMTFTHLARYAEGRAKTIEQLRRAVRYPLFLLAVAGGVVVFMMTMVVPQIIQFLNSIDSQLPLMTRMLIGVSAIVAANWWIAGLVLIALFPALHFLRRHSESAARTIDDAILHLPLIGIVWRKMALTRFAQSFAVLFRSGVGIPHGLKDARATLGNKALEYMLIDAERQVQSGCALSTALNSIFPPFAIRMLRTGERSGQLANALDRIATTCEREANEAAEKLIGAMEPVLTLLIGGLLGWIVLAVLGPIYGNLAKITGVG